MHLSKKFATAIATLIEANYGEFVDILEAMEYDAETMKDPSYGVKRKRVAVVVEHLLSKLEQAK